MLNKTQIKSIIVDDESKSRSNLQNLLNTYCPEVEVIGDFELPSRAINFLKKEEVQCIFLDIEMPEMSGFEFLDHIDTSNVYIIFVTGYSDYAIQALKSKAFDYVLKPIKIAELEQSVFQLRQQLAEIQPIRSNGIPVQSIKKRDENKRLSIPDTHGFKLVDVTQIIRIAADGGYSKIYFRDAKPFLLSRNIGYLESLLNPSKFVRVHHSHVINLDFLDTYTTRDGGVVTMIDGAKIGIAKRRVKDFKLKVDAYQL